MPLHCRVHPYAPSPYPYRTYLLPDTIKSLTLQSSLPELNSTETRNKKTRPAVRASLVHGNDRGRLDGDLRVPGRRRMSPFPTQENIITDPHTHTTSITLFRDVALLNAAIAILTKTITHVELNHAITRATCMRDYGNLRFPWDANRYPKETRKRGARPSARAWPSRGTHGHPCIPTETPIPCKKRRTTPSCPSLAMHTYT
jgi:hypothetical protein